MRIKIVAGVIGEDDRHAAGAGVAQGQLAAQERMLDMHDIHGAHAALRGARVAQVDADAGIFDAERQARRADHVQLIILIVFAAKGEDEDRVALRLSTRLFSVT